LEIRVKAELYRDLLHHIRQQGFSQGDLVTRLGVHQPDVSNLLNGRISKFSLSKLIRFAGKLSLRAEIRLIQPRSAKLPVVSASGRARKSQAAA
jgi:predicted XRE-type DNA-binding protein